MLKFSILNFQFSIIIRTFEFHSKVLSLENKN